MNESLNVYVSEFKKAEEIPHSKEITITGNTDRWFVDLYCNNKSFTQDEVVKIKLGNGFNIWDEQWELGTIEQNSDLSPVTTAIRTKNYISVLPNIVYYINTSRWRDIHCYDESYQHLGVATYTASGSGYTFTTLSGAKYIKVPFTTSYGTIYKNDICINLSQSVTTIWPHNGIYVPYQGQYNASQESNFPKYLKAERSFSGSTEFIVTGNINGFIELDYIKRHDNTIYTDIFKIEENHLKSNIAGEIGLKFGDEILWVTFKNRIAYYYLYNDATATGSIYFNPKSLYKSYNNSQFTPLINIKNGSIEDAGTFDITNAEIYNFEYDYANQAISIDFKTESDIHIILNCFWHDGQIQWPETIEEAVNLLGLQYNPTNMERMPIVHNIYPQITLSIWDDGDQEYEEETTHVGYIETTAKEINGQTYYYVVYNRILDTNYSLYCTNSSSCINIYFNKDALGYNKWNEFDQNNPNLRPIDGASGNSLPYYNFEPKGVITDYIALQWQDNYNQPGSFSLILVDTEENRDLLKIDRYLLIEKSDKIMIIEKIKYNAELRSDGYIIEASGRSLESILDRRVAFPGIGLNTDTCKSDKGLIHALYLLVHNYFIDPGAMAQESSDGQMYFYYPERKIPFMDDSFLQNEDGYLHYDSEIKRPFNNSINKSVSKDNILKVIQEQCQASYLGFKIVPYVDSYGTTWRFLLYTGEDKSYSRSDKTKPLLIFSPKLNNVSAIATTEDNTNYKNAIFCGTEKDADSYINLVKNLSEDLNLNIPKVITGIKDRISAALTNSKPCWTGILYLALAAARTDKDYSATVTKVDGTEFLDSSLFIVSNNYSIAYIDSDNLPYANSSDPSMYTKQETNNTTFYIFNRNVKIMIGVGSTWYDVVCKLYYNNTTWIEGNKMLTVLVTSTCYIHGTNTSGGNFFDVISNGQWSTAGISNIGIYYTKQENVENRMIAIERDTEDTGAIIKVGNADATGVYNKDSDVFVDFDTENQWVSDLNGDNNSIKKGTLINGYVTKAMADAITITYRKTYGDETSGTSKTGTFTLSDVDAFKDSTQYGWLTVPILKQAIQDLNDSKWGDDGIISGLITNVEKRAVSLWFKTFDAYTSNSTLKKWLCQTYVSNTSEIGINRREVFVEEQKEDDDDWNASAIAQWAANTKAIKTEDIDDEDSDEKINERLKESARKQAGDYRKVRDVDADCETIEYEYLGSDSKGYKLGDIVQIDDGRGNVEKKIIAGVTIANDTTSGFRIVPTFAEYTLIPKDYRQLDWIQVANMILPAEFDKQADAANTMTDQAFKPNNYGGASKTEINQPDSPKSIISIYNEVASKVTELDLKATYVVKPNSENNLKTTFSLISAIGQTEKYDRDSGGSPGKLFYYIPMMLCCTKQKHIESFDFYLSHGTPNNDYSIYYRMGEHDEEHNIGIVGADSIFKKYIGVGYNYLPIRNNNYFYDSSFLKKDISTFNENGHDFTLNKLYEDYMKIRLYNGSSSPNNHIDITTINNRKKSIIYSKSFVDGESNLIFNRPQTEKILLTQYSLGTEADSKKIKENPNSSYEYDMSNNTGAILLNPLAIGVRNASLSTYLLYYGNQILKVAEFSLGMGNPSVNYHMFGYHSYGQIYYNYSSGYYNYNNEVDITNHSRRTNLILGGFAVCKLTAKYHDTLKVDNDEIAFSQNDTPSEGNALGHWSFDEGYGDTENGVRVFSLAVYEYNSASRCCKYEPKEGDDQNNFRNLAYSEYFNSGGWKQDFKPITGNNTPENFNGSELDSALWPDYQQNTAMFNAEFPDLKSRRLVHNYIPVEYIGGSQNEIEDNRERFGFYDTIEQMFVPVNWKWANNDGSVSKNDDAVLIAYGGYTENI